VKLAGIRSVEVERNANGNPTRVGIVFGPHYFLELRCAQSGAVSFILGATHHGFKADASEVAGQLEQIIEEVRRAHPDLTVD
jgi:hypothetical protein